jgi:hypothetical protein
MELAFCPLSSDKNFEAAIFFFFLSFFLICVPLIWSTSRSPEGRPSFHGDEFQPYTLRQYFHTLWRQPFLKLGLDISFRKGFFISIPDTKEAFVISLYKMLRKIVCCPTYSVGRHSIPLVTTFKRNRDATRTDFRDQNEDGHREEGRKTTNATVNLSFSYSPRTLTRHCNMKVTQYRWGPAIQSKLRSLMCFYVIVTSSPKQIWIFINTLCICDIFLQEVNWVEVFNSQLALTKCLRCYVTTFSEGGLRTLKVTAATCLRLVFEVNTVQCRFVICCWCLHVSLWLVIIDHQCLLCEMADAPAVCYFKNYLLYSVTVHVAITHF